MAEQHEQSHDHAAEVTERNVAQMRELLAKKHQDEQQHQAEPPLADDPNNPSGENPLVQEATGSRGSTGGIRNMRGGRS
jgi:hypothetical protein